ncbi:hypothetical protein Ahia01_001357000 [Argonauta hians]
METTDDKMEDPVKSIPEEKPPIDGMTPEVDGMTPEVDGMASVTDGVTPATDRMTPEVDGMTTAADGMTPQTDDKTPEVDGKTPAANGMTPAADGMTPEVDSVTPAANIERRLSQYDTGDNDKFVEKYCCTCMLKLYSLFNRICLAILDGIENNFYKLGVLTGSYPFIFIICGLLLSLFGFGIKNQKIGAEEKQWTPESMLDQLKNIEEFKKWNIRMQKEEDGFLSGSPKYIIIVDKRMLTQEALLEDREWDHNFTDRFFHNNPTMFNELHPMTQVYYNDGNKGFDDDMMFIGIGYTTMVGLAITGLLCVGIGYVVTLGVCGFAGIEYSLLNHVLPLLLLGIGVDDTFVIVGALNSLSKEEKELPVKEQIGLTMKHAGISITITTLTDIVSFAIGSYSVIVVIFTLALCVFCSWNIFYLEVDSNYVRFLYTMDTPYYSYALADQKYFPDRDIGIYCNYIPYSTQQPRYLNMSHELLETPKIDAPSSQNWMMSFYRWAQTKKSINGGIVPPEKFDLLLFKYLEINDGKPYVKYIQVEGKEMCLMNIPKTPFCTELICGPINSPIVKLKCVAEMMNIFTISCACNIIMEFQVQKMECMCQTPNCTDKIHKDTSTRFQVECFPSKYLCYFQQNMQHFDRNICLNRSIIYPMTKILLKMNIIDNYEEKLNLMHHLEHVIEKYYADSCVAFARYYIQWKMNSVLAWEMKRNISLAFLTVFLITIVMIMNWKISLMVVISVIFTMIDILGLLKVWGLYVDTTSCVLLTLAVGLIFDYSVHIGFTYIRLRGHKDDRMIVTLKEMGPPVFHGGFSTFIAVIPLCLGNTYPFKTFFKVMFLVVSIGLYHGLIFLPVILSLFGPRPYPTAKKVDMSNLHTR